MISFARLLAYGCLLVSSMISCSTSHKSVRNQSATPTSSYADSLKRELQTLLNQTLIPGFAVAIVQNQTTLFSQGFGYANLKNKVLFTPKTINSVASISKTLIGLSIMKLVEDGKLDLDEPINAILPYKVTNPFYPNKAITVRHLVTHTSTLTQEFDPEDVGESTIMLTDSFRVSESTPAFLKKEIAYYQLGQPISIDRHIRKFTQPTENWYSKENFANYPPGSRFHYSNLGSLVAARIVELKSGFSFDEYTRRYILKPLNMVNSAWHYKEVPPAQATTLYTVDDRKKPTKVLEHPRYEMTDYPVGGLKTNIEDLTKYLLELTAGYSGKGTLLSAQSYQVLLNSQLADSCFESRNDYIFNDQYNVAVFWAVSSPGYRMHNGGSIGVYSFIYFNPKTGMGALAFCNLPHSDFGKIRDIVHKYEVLWSQ